MREFIKRKLHESLNETKEDRFNQFVTDLGAKPEGSKNGVYAYKFGPSTLYFKNTPKRSTIELDLIHTPIDSRGSGSARKAFNEWLSYVDKYGFIVEAIIAARDTHTSEKMLAKFYASLGFRFQEMGGFESDFEIIRYRGGR